MKSIDELQVIRVSMAHVNSAIGLGKEEMDAVLQQEELFHLQGLLAMALLPVPTEDWIRNNSDVIVKKVIEVAKTVLKIRGQEAIEEDFIIYYAWTNAASIVGLDSNEAHDLLEKVMTKEEYSHFMVGVLLSEEKPKLEMIPRIAKKTTEFVDRFILEKQVSKILKD